MRASALLPIMLLGLFTGGCDEDGSSTEDGLPAAITGEPKVIFTDARADQTIPFSTGGLIKFRLTADLGKLCGPVRATVDLVETPLPAGVAAGTVVTLIPKERCGAHEGAGQLAWPAGGTVKLRVTLAGNSQDFDARLDKPSLALKFGGQTRSGLLFLVDVCAESTAASGEVHFKLSGAQTRGGAAEEQVVLGQGGCAGDLPASGSLTSARLKVLTAEQAFRVAAELVGTSYAIDAEKPLTENLGDVGLSVAAGVPTVPLGTSSVEVIATVTLAAAVANGVPVRFETNPETEILPASVVTDENGEARTYVLVPEDVTHLRVDAVVGNQRSGVTLSRPP